MNAREYLKSIGAEWDIDNYTEMWVPGDKLPKILEDYHTLKSQEEAEEIINLFSKWHNLELGSFELEAAIKELIDKR